VTGPLPDPRWTAEERAAYRAFVREHHPDRGGDPEVFVAGLARFRDPPGPASGDRVRDAPAEVVPALPLPTRVVVALIRTVRHRRRARADRPREDPP
jgi:hypothetical protein